MLSNAEAFDAKQSCVGVPTARQKIIGSNLIYL